MIPQEFNYSRPKTIQDATDLLASNDAKILAGGMSLIPLMKLRLATPEHLVDLCRVSDLNHITENSGFIHVGALTTHHQVETSDLLKTKCPLLAETASHIGDSQVRNMGTLGGSTAHADPAADYPAALCALEAKVRIVRKNSERLLPIDEFFVDSLTTALAPEEIISELVFPVEPPGNTFAYRKLRQPASGFAIVGVAVRIRMTEEKIDMVRIGVTGLASKAFRPTNVEEFLCGSRGTPKDINTASALVDEGIQANTDLHASSDYRRQMARIYTARALTDALERTT